MTSLELKNIFAQKEILSKEDYIIEINKIFSDLEKVNFENFYLKYKEKYSTYSRKNSIKILLPLNIDLKKHHLEYWIERNYSKKEAELLAKKYKKILDKSRSRFCVEFWIKKGFSEEEAKEEISKIQAKNSKKSLDNRRKTGYEWSVKKRKKKKWKKEGFSEKEIEKKWKSYIEKNNNLHLEYYLERGFSEEEAKEEIFKTQRKRSLKRHSKKYTNPKEYKKGMNVFKEFYEAKGFSEEEAIEKLKERQSTFSLKYCIEKYGEKEGNRIFNERQKKWQNSMELLDEHTKNKIKKANANASLEYHVEKYGEREGTEKFIVRQENRMNSLRSSIKSFNFKYGSSKESYKMFKEIEHYFASKKKKYNLTFLYGEDEYGIYGNNKMNFYDFTIPELNILVEYHGTHVHPNPEWNEEIKENWVHAFNKTNYEENYNRDLEKRKLAEEKGFVVYEYYSDQNETEFIEKIINIIEKKYE